MDDCASLFFFQLYSVLITLVCLVNIVNINVIIIINITENINLETLTSTGLLT